MNALPLFTLVSPKIAVRAGDGTAPAAPVMAEGEQAEDSENAQFSALFDMLVVPPMIALPASNGSASKVTLPVAGTGKNLPVVLPVLPEAAAKSAAALPGASMAVPAVAAASPDAIAEDLAAILTAPKPAAETTGKLKPVDPAAQPLAALLPTLRMAAAKQDVVEPAAQQAIPIPAATEFEPEAEPAAVVDTPQRPEAAPAQRIMLAQNGAEMQVQFLSPPSLEAKASAAPAPVAAPADRIDGFQGSQRLEELVQAIAHARETGSQPVRATTSHAEFGMLALKLTREDGGVSAQIASGDAAFAPAAHAAVRAAAEAGLAGQQRGDDQPRHHGAAPDQAQGQSSASAHAQSQPQTGGERGLGGQRPQPRADTQSDPASQADDSRERDRPQGRSSGLYA